MNRVKLLSLATTLGLSLLAIGLLQAETSTCETIAATDSMAFEKEGAKQQMGCCWVYFMGMWRCIPCEG